MGRIDVATYKYMSDNARFADIFNYYLYDGKRVIAADRLHELDTRELAMPYGEDGVAETIQKYRDILKYMCAMEDDKAAYLLLGIENQDKQHYAMPVRNMLYDAAQYVKQVSRASASNRDAKRGISGEEYLSGFCRDDKLLPVITLVIFWSAEEWDAPTSIHEMISVDDAEILKYVPDYKINLVIPYRMCDDDFSKFETSIAKAFKFIKYSNDKGALRSMLDSDRDFEAIDRETAELIRTVAKSDVIFDEKGSVVNMCLAEQQMKQEAAEERAIEIAKNLLQIGKNTIDEIAKATGLKLEEVEALASN